MTQYAEVIVPVQIITGSMYFILFHVSYQVISLIWKNVVAYYFLLKWYGFESNYASPGNISCAFFNASS